MLSSLSSNGSQSYEYDANGNRTRLVIGANSYNYSIDPNSNRLASVDGPVAKTNSFDNAGEITSDGSYVFTYDTAGRLVGASYPGGNTFYTFNAFGQRTLKSNGTTGRYFVYGEDGKLMGEYDLNGQMVQETIYVGGRPVAVKTPQGIYYIYTDHLNTPRAITDTSNTVVWRWDSDPFGTDMANEDPDGDLNNFEYNLRFPGQYFDGETGLHYNYYRYYDPSTGRYVTSDPIGLKGGLNTYGYVLSNPVKFIDPNGTELPPGAIGPLFIGELGVATHEAIIVTLGVGLAAEAAGAIGYGAATAFNNYICDGCFGGFGIWLYNTTHPWEDIIPILPPLPEQPEQNNYTPPAPEQPEQPDSEKCQQI